MDKQQLKMNIKTKMELICPKRAEYYLSKIDEKHQRHLMPAVVENYALAMSQNQWLPNHQGIAFDEKGRLIDGQHRLQAIKQSGVTLNLMVTHGLPEKQSNGINLYTIDTIDRGKMRGIGQQLALRHGYTNGNRVAAACSAILYVACKDSGIRMSIPIALHILNIYGTHVTFYDENVANIQGLRMGAVIGALAVCRNAFRNETDAFFNALMSGEGLKKGMPVHTLREYLLSGRYSHNGGGKERVKVIVNAAMIAAMHHVLGNNLGSIRSGVLGTEFFESKQKSELRKIKTAAGLSQ